MSNAARDESAAGMAAAMRSLARRALCRAEVAARLVANGFEEAIVAAVLARLEELKLVDDAALAQHRVEAGRSGRHRVRSELLRRGVPEDVLEHAIKDAVAPDTERASARDALERYLRARSRRKDTPQRVRAAAFRHLISRGFPADLVRDLLGVSL